MLYLTVFLRIRTARPQELHGVIPTKRQLLRQTGALVRLVELTAGISWRRPPKVN
jgi:hypothetical protein